MNKLMVMSLMVFMGVSALRAAPVLPPGAIVEMQLTGRENFGPAYDKSALGQILHDPKMQTFLERPKEWLTEKIQSGKPGTDVEPARKLVHKLLSKPSAFGAYPGTKVGIVWVSALGADAPEVEKLLAEAQKNIHLGVGEGQDRSVIVKDTFLFASTPELMTAAKAALEKPPASSPETDLVAGTPVGWLRADMPAMLKMLHEQLSQADVAGKFDRVVKALGVDSVRQVDVAGSFDGPAIRLVSRLTTGGEATGLMKAFTALPPLDDPALKMLPRDVASGSVSRMNMLAVWDGVMEAFKNGASDEQRQKVDAKRADLEATLQFNLRDDLIASLGDTLAFYSTASVSPLIPGTTAMVVTLKDPAKFSACLEKLVTYGNQQLANRAGEIRWNIQSANVEGRKVYTLTGFPFLMPSATVKSNRLIVAMNALALTAALDQVENPKSSILDNADFQRSRKTLPAQAVAISYEDTRQAVAGIYGMMALAGPMLAAQAKLPFDMNLLPPLPNIQDKLFGTVSELTATPQGLTMNSYGPFGSKIGIGGGSGMAVAMLLPALNQARGRARQAECANNLKQIGLACHMYADEHNGQFPDKLEVLAGDYLKDKDVLHCPSAPGRPDSLSYGYIRGLTSKDSDKVLAFDAEGNHRTGRNVLFGDGHVQWMPEAQFQDAVRQQTK